MRPVVYALSAALITALAPDAHAVTIIDTFGAGDTIGSGDFIPHESTARDLDWAMGFSVEGTDVQLEIIELGLSLFNRCGVSEMDPCPNEFQVQILTDAGGVPSSTVLDSISVSGGLSDVRGSIVSVASASNPVLYAGSSYWVAVSASTPGGAESFLMWYEGVNTLNTDPRAHRTDLAPWSDEQVSESLNAAYRLTGTDSELAQCEADLDDALEALGQCEEDLAAALADPRDEDGDGEGDPTDTCPGTAVSEPVDGDGCSVSQFCALVDVNPGRGRAACNNSDWMNDEPLGNP